MHAATNLFCVVDSAKTIPPACVAFGELRLSLLFQVQVRGVLFSSKTTAVQLSLASVSFMISLLIIRYDTT